MYQNIDNMICDADSCEAAICECKRMRKADITAAIIWAAVAVSAFLLILLDAILDINIGDVVAYILLFMLIRRRILWKILRSNCKSEDEQRLFEVE